jgi:hypothetical protein
VKKKHERRGERRGGKGEKIIHNTLYNITTLKCIS